MNAETFAEHICSLDLLLTNSTLKWWATAAVIDFGRPRAVRTRIRSGGAVRPAELEGMTINLSTFHSNTFTRPQAGDLASFPPPDEWDDWVDYGPNDLPDSEERHYALVPTVCFNCEAACGLLAYVDKESLDIHKIEGHPLHPGSRGRNCPKGPATLNQVNNPDRILKPLKRVGDRGEGQWEEVTWDEALDDIAGRIRAAIQGGQARWGGLPRGASG